MVKNIVNNKTRSTQNWNYFEEGLLLIYLLMIKVNIIYMYNVKI